MANSLFNVLGGNQPVNGMAQFIQEVKNFQKTFTGSPKEEVQKMMNDGRLSQAQFDQYAKMANQIMAIMPKQ